jgi:O-antigen/teichoic acid export membrane protein
MVSVQIGMALGLLTDSFNKAYVPYLFRTLKTVDSKGRRALVRSTYLYIVIVTLIATLIGSFAPDILGIVAGEKFRAASGTLIFIATGYAFNGMYYMVTNYIFYEKKTAYLSGLTLGCGCFNALISYFLIARLGVLGAAIGFMCAQALLFVGTWIIAHRVHPMPWGKALFYRMA